MTGGARLSLRGTVVSGTGRMAEVMTTGPNAKSYAQAFGALSPGTFNVELPEPYLLQPDMAFRGLADGDELLMQRCHVENLDAFLVRTAKAQTSDGNYPLNVLEIVAAYPLRRYLRLHDGSAVEVSVAAPAEPSNSKGRQ